MESILAEKWKDVPGYEGYYQVSNLGRVKSITRKILNRGRVQIRQGVLRKSKKNSSGYEMVLLSKEGKHKNIAVHVLVGKAFLEPCPGKHGCLKGEYQIHHKDNNKNNNHASNLMWILTEDHIEETNNSPNKVIRKGEQVGTSKLTEADVIKIRQDYRPANEIAKEYGVTEFAIFRILNNRVWKHLAYENQNEQKKARKNNRAKGERMAAAKLTNDDVRKIRKDTRYQKDIAQDYGIDQTTVSKIKLRQSWKHVPD